jgi:hypothetical protein
MQCAARNLTACRISHCTVDDKQPVSRIRAPRPSIMLTFRYFARPFECNCVHLALMSTHQGVVDVCLAITSRYLRQTDGADAHIGPAAVAELFASSGDTSKLFDIVQVQTFEARGVTISMSLICYKSSHSGSALDSCIYNRKRRHTGLCRDDIKRTVRGE